MNTCRGGGQGVDGGMGDANLWANQTVVCLDLWSSASSKTGHQGGG